MTTRWQILPSQKARAFIRAQCEVNPISEG